MKNIYIASCVPDGGILRYEMSESGKLKFIDKTPLDRPMYMTEYDGRLYVIVREYDGKNSGVVSYKINADGVLSDMQDHGSAMGECGCHILADECGIYCANYISGSVSRLPDTVIDHNFGEKVAHVHFVGATPDKKYVCVCDLGLDTVFVYDRELKLVSQAKVPEGDGVRHLVFSEDGKYVFSANELGETASAFSYSDGKLALLDTVKLLPDDYTGKKAAAAIRIHNGKIYVSSRDVNLISELEFDGKTLKKVSDFDCGGYFPRDFDFVGEYVVSANQLGNTVTVVKPIDSGAKLIDKVEAEAPLCVHIV